MIDWQTSFTPAEAEEFAKLNAQLYDLRKIVFALAKQKRVLEQNTRSRYRYAQQKLTEAR